MKKKKDINVTNVNLNYTNDPIDTFVNETELVYDNKENITVPITSNLEQESITENLEQETTIEQESITSKETTSNLEQETTICPSVGRGVVETTIYDKYQKYIDMAKSGYIRDFNYKMSMEVLRYIERIKGKKIGLNLSCGKCLIDLLLLLDKTR